MIKRIEYPLENIKSLIKKEKESMDSIEKYSEEAETNKYPGPERQMILKRMEMHEQELKEYQEKILENLNKLNNSEKILLAEDENVGVYKKRTVAENKNYIFQEDSLKTIGGKIYSLKEMGAKNLEKQTFRRIREDRKKIASMKKKPKKNKKNNYSEISSKFFSKVSKKL